MTSLEALKACWLFKGFTDTGLQILAAIATPRAFPKGVPLFVESMLGDSMFVLSEGKVRITSKAASGEDISLIELGPGECLGELALVVQSQRMATATAIAGVMAFEIRSVDFQKLLAQKPQACIKLLMSITSGFGQKIQENRDAFKVLLPKA